MVKIKLTEQLVSASQIANASTDLSAKVPMIKLDVQIFKLFPIRPSVLLIAMEC